MTFQKIPILHLTHTIKQKFLHYSGFYLIFNEVTDLTRVSVQGIKSLGGHYACLCQEFEFYKVKKNCHYFSKRKWKYFYTFYHFYFEESSKRAK